MEGTVSLENPKGLRHEVEDVAAKAAWDEWEDVQKYVLYTTEELAEIAKKKAEEQEAIKSGRGCCGSLKHRLRLNRLKISHIDAIDAGYCHDDRYIDG